ncbi:MAG: isopentenyl phosphate kinase [Thaumarchaeota archaeon]|nr:isopentenyl phosphate kinase [Nitrososphaerota archaeon]
MGKVENLVIIKLGGSLITDKDRPLSINLSNLRVVCREISSYLSTKIPSKIFLIHGGGSFGHFFAKRFGLTTTFSKLLKPEGIAMTLGSMLQLHSIVLEQLNSKEVFCATILPSELMSIDGKRLTPNGVMRAVTTISAGLTPITFGYVMVDRRGSRIVSGDEIALALARRFRSKKVIFAMDVDGIYPSSKLEGEILPMVSSNRKIDWLQREYDVTGGIGEKLRTGLQLSKAGAEVFFVNGSKESRLSSILRGRDDVICTRILPKKHLQ